MGRCGEFLHYILLVYSSMVWDAVMSFCLIFYYVFSGDMGCRDEFFVVLTCVYFPTVWDFMVSSCVYVLKMVDDDYGK